MSLLSKIAYSIRHSKLLNNADWLWDLLRKPYHFVLNFKNSGVAVVINDSLTIRVPPEFYKIDLADYERESTDQIVEWIQANPSCYIMDIGCSIGYVSAVSLFASADADVVGFDSDLPSLKASQLMCQYAPNKKFHIVYGLISDETKIDLPIHEVIANSNKALAASNVTGMPGTTAYINLDKVDTTAKNIPIYTIDELYKDAALNKPVLIKCDIEGAELFALRGADKFIDKYRPTMLLSVHPDILPVFGHTVQQVRDYLKSKNYTIQVIAIDHEEHWWCNG